MSEVKRYTVEKPQMLQHFEHHSLGTVERVVVHASDFDRVTVERDALQLRLNAADQRIDDAIDLLHRSHAVVDGTGWTDLERDIVAFFKPAEAERDHQIPGTSGMRLNMQANQGE